MKVAIDCRKAGDFGIGTYIRGLLTGLESLDSNDEFVLLAPASVANRLPGTARFHHVHFDAPNYSLREIIALGRAAEAQRAELIHVPHYIAPITRLPLVTTIHDVIHLKVDRRQLPLFGRSYARWMISRAAKRSRRIIVPTAAVENDLSQLGYRAGGRIRVIAESADPRFFGAAPERSLLSRFALDETPYVLFVGNDKPHKNVETLVRAFEVSPELRRDYRLALVGATFQRYERREEIVRCGFVDDDELHALYAHAAAMVMPSLHEGFGLPLLEAMASGTPAVISRDAALKEVAGGAAIVADESDPAAIAAAIGRAIDSRSELSVRGRARAARFSWQATAEATLATYREARS